MVALLVEMMAVMMDAWMALKKVVMMVA